MMDCKTDIQIRCNGQFKTANAPLLTYNHIEKDKKVVLQKTNDPRMKGR